VVLPPQGSAPKPLKRCSDADWRNVGGGSIVVAGPASGRVCFVKADGDRAPEIAYGVRTSGHDEQWACHANRKGHLGKLGYERFGGMLAR
jgi:hypothetical protein